MPKNIIIVIGGQYGSEAKGKHVQDLCHTRDDIKTVVRTGAPNAGHSMVVRNGNDQEYVAMQLLPCGWTAPNIRSLIVGAGAQVIPEMLKKEYDLVRKHSDAEVIIDRNAMIQTEDDSKVEGQRELDMAIGSTKKGCGHALARRISRSDKSYESYLDFKMRTEGNDSNYYPPSVDTIPAMNKLSGNIIVEGTQGAGLSLYHGEYPYTTSRDTNAAEWLAEAGLSPRSVREIHMVVRTFPIRVAGNSGTLSNELSWAYFFKQAELNKMITKEFEDLDNNRKAEGVNPRTRVKDICAEMEQKYEKKWEPFKKLIEFTTVTKLPRRIGMFDYEMFERMVMINQPTHVALEFCNYLTAKYFGIEEVTPLMPYVYAKSGSPFIKHGTMSYEFLASLVENDNRLAPIMNMIDRLNEIMAKWAEGKVTHLGISRDSTLILTY